MREKFKIIIIDDHAIVRNGLLTLIEQEKNMVISDSDDGRNVIKKIEKHTPDLIILDLSLNGINGLDLLATIKSFSPETHVLIFSMHDEKIFAERSLKAGASGFIMKSEQPETIIVAIRKVLSGKIYMSEQMMEYFVYKAMNLKTTEAIDSIETFTDREFQVFNMIGNGMRNRQIAEILHLSIKTIDTFRENIKHKLNLKSASELTQYAVKWMLSKNVVQ